MEWENPPYMTNNGLVLADLTWKPVAYEVKQAYCPEEAVRGPVIGAGAALVPQGPGVDGDVVFIGQGHPHGALQVSARPGGIVACWIPRESPWTLRPDGLASSGSKSKTAWCCSR